MFRKIIYTALVFALLFSFSSVLADNDGRDSWCNSDQYGCWVTDEDGGQCYIMFWSEEARAWFMGGHSKPGELVVSKPELDNGKLILDKPSDAGKTKLSGEACFIYCANLDWGDNLKYETCVKQECGVDTPPNVPSEWKNK